MANFGTPEEQRKAIEASFLEIGNQLARPPSSEDELLNLLGRVELLLSLVLPMCSCRLAMRSMNEAIHSAGQALISDGIFRHPDINIQVAVACCINEMVRITIYGYPYSDYQMKKIFRLFMVAFKQLSGESGKNYERALRILKTVEDARSRLIRLDMDTGTMVVEMFQFFLDTIRPNHSSDIFDHMKKIMILITEESESMDLLRPLLSSVKMNNKNTLPRSWELAKSVIEHCATRLQPHIRAAVKAMNLNVADYADIVASLCQDTPIGNDTVANEEVTSVNGATTVQPVATDATGDGVFVVNKMAQVDNFGIAVDIEKEHESGDAGDKVEESPLSMPAKTIGGGIPSCSVCAVKGKVSHSSGDPKGKGKNETNLQKRESGEDEHKIDGSPPVKRVKAKHSEGKEKSSNESKKARKSNAGKKKVNHSMSDPKGKDENEIARQKHASRDVADKEPMDFLEYGRELVNLRIKVWWPLDRTYYTGTVESYDPVTRKHKIKYDDDEEEMLHMSEERWELFNEMQSRQAQPSCRQEADPSPVKKASETCKKPTKTKAGPSEEKEHANPSPGRGPRTKYLMEGQCDEPCGLSRAAIL